MNKPDQKVIIVPCSGIGKPYGTVSREAAYQLSEEDRPDSTEIVALSLLVLGDEEAHQAISRNPVLTIDGCKLACASKMVKESGGAVVHEFDVLDVFRRNRQFKPQGIAELNEDGLKLASALSLEMASVVDTILAGKKPEGNKHA